MSKFMCRCGYVMTFRTGREEYDLTLIPNSGVEDVIDTFDKYFNSEKFIEIIDSGLLQVMRCPQCDRLWVEEKIRSGKFRAYIKESSE